MNQKNVVTEFTEDTESTEKDMNRSRSVCSVLSVAAFLSLSLPSLVAHAAENGEAPWATPSSVWKCPSSAANATGWWP